MSKSVDVEELEQYVRHLRLKARHAKRLNDCIPASEDAPKPQTLAGVEAGPWVDAPGCGVYGRYTPSGEWVARASNDAWWVLVDGRPKANQYEGGAGSLSESTAAADAYLLSHGALLVDAQGQRLPLRTPLDWDEFRAIRPIDVEAGDVITGTVGHDHRIIRRDDAVIGVIDASQVDAIQPDALNGQVVSMVVLRSGRRLPYRLSVEDLAWQLGIGAGVTITGDDS